MAPDIEQRWIWRLINIHVAGGRFILSTSSDSDSTGLAQSGFKFRLAFEQIQGNKELIH